ncbi:MAG: HNH endonuclease family protein [Fimbriimonadaceae bacterium]
MKIDLRNVKIAELVAGYEDKNEEGVTGFGGKLNIRPPYQREFIYGEKQRNEVIQTVRKGFPLNTMYWVVAGDGFELMDGQQRTVSICQYVAGDFSVIVDDSPMYWGNLTSEQQKQILDYELSIYVCEGEEKEKLDWFEIINIAGEKLTDQELRNAIYTGPWLADAKRWFSRTGCPAAGISDNYVNGSPIRQELLEKALDWKSRGAIKEYMSAHQHDADANELWQYYQAIFDWVRRVFPEYRKMMKGLPWGKFYNAHKDDSLNATILEARIVELIDDDEVDNKKGIYEFLLTGIEKSLNLRTFPDKMKQKVFEKQKGVCPICKKKFELGQMEADHIVPWSRGGKTVLENCQMLCQLDNRTKSGR